MRFDLESTRDVLRRTPGIFVELLGDIDEVWSHATEGPERIDGEETDWIPRARIVLAGGANPVFESYDRFRHRERNAHRSLASLLKEFATLRASNLDALASWRLSEADLERQGTHPSLGLVTLRQFSRRG